MSLAGKTGQQHTGTSQAPSSANCARQVVASKSLWEVDMQPLSLCEIKIQMPKFHFPQFSIFVNYISLDGLHIFDNFIMVFWLLNLGLLVYRIAQWIWAYIQCVLNVNTTTKAAWICLNLANLNCIYWASCIFSSVSQTIQCSLVSHIFSNSWRRTFKLSLLILKVESAWTKARFFCCCCQKWSSFEN